MRTVLEVGEKSFFHSLVVYPCSFHLHYVHTEFLVGLSKHLPIFKQLVYFVRANLLKTRYYKISSHLAVSGVLHLVTLR